MKEKYLKKKRCRKIKNPASFLYSRKVLLVGELSVLDNYSEC